MLLDLRGVLVVPDRAHGDHVAAAHEPRAAGDVGRARELPQGDRTTRCSPIAVKNTAVVRRPRAHLRLPDPAHRGGADERGATRRGIYSALAYLPVVIPPVVAVLLWKTFYDAELDRRLQHRCSAGSHLGPYPWLQSQRCAMPSLVLESTWANAGGTVIIYLAALTGVDTRAVRGGVGRRRVALAQGLAHHAAAAARRPARDDDPADHRDRAGLPRAVPVHLGRPGERDADGAAADLQLRVRELARRGLRRARPR